MLVVLFGLLHKGNRTLVFDLRLFPRFRFSLTSPRSPVFCCLYCFSSSKITANDRSTLQTYVTRWIIAADLPFNATEHPDFKILMTKLNKHWDGTHSQTVKKTIGCEFAEYCKAVKKLFLHCKDHASGQPFIHLMHDSCTFVDKISYLGISAKIITPNWQITNLALALLPHSHSHNSQDVAKSIQSHVCSLYELEINAETLMTVVSDTAASALSIAEHLSGFALILCFYFLVVASLMKCFLIGD